MQLTMGKTAHNFMIRPVRDNVVVRPVGTQELSEGGIVVPKSFQKPSNKVEVMAVGPGIAGKPMAFSPGQIAFRVKDWGTEIWENGVQYFIMNQEALLATLN